MTTCQGSALLLGIDHLDAGAPDRIRPTSRPRCHQPGDGIESDALLRLLGPELHTDPGSVERTL